MKIQKSSIYHASPGSRENVNRNDISSDPIKRIYHQNRNLNKVTSQQPRGSKFVVVNSKIKTGIQNEDSSVQSGSGDILTRQNIYLHGR